MRKQSFFPAILCLILGVAACSKKPSPPPPLSYTLGGLHSLTVLQYADTSLSLPVTVSYVGGTKEMITVATAGKTDGITVTPAAASGTPSFTTPLTVHIAKSTVGSFPVTVSSSSSSTATQSQSFTVIITANPNCANAIAGRYVIADDPASHGDQQITAISSDVVSIPYPPLGTLTAHLDCTNGTLTTDGFASAYGNVNWGTGTFSATQITVSFTVRAPDPTYGGYMTTDYNRTFTR